MARSGYQKGARQEGDTPDKHDLLTIGQMADLNGLSARALRVYQDHGLIEPAYIDEQTGRRYWDLVESRKIDMLHELQDVGFSLSEIEAVSASSDLRVLRDLVEEHLEDLRRKQQQLAIMQASAEDIIEGINLYFDNGIYDQIIIQRLPERHILVFPIADESTLDCDPSETQRVWEILLHDAKRSAKAKGYPRSIFRNVGCAVPWDRVMQGITKISYLYLYVNESFGPCFADAETIPEGTYLTYHGNLAYLPNGEGIGAHTLPRMLDYARSKGFSIAGDYFEDVFCRWPCMFGDAGHMLYRLSLPITAKTHSR
jgi:DNA-binding transcriptional MerR regulator